MPLQSLEMSRKLPNGWSTLLPLFENRSPQHMLATDEGLTLVEQTLTRIEHNIPSQAEEHGTTR